jgi:hypothetical protein
MVPSLDVVEYEGRVSGRRGKIAHYAARVIAWTALTGIIGHRNIRKGQAVTTRNLILEKAVVPRLHRLTQKNNLVDKTLLLTHWEGREKPITF